MTRNFESGQTPWEWYKYYFIFILSNCISKQTACSSRHLCLADTYFSTFLNQQNGMWSDLTLCIICNLFTHIVFRSGEAQPSGIFCHSPSLRNTDIEERWLWVLINILSELVSDIRWPQIWIRVIHIVSENRRVVTLFWVSMGYSRPSSVKKYYTFLLTINDWR